MKTDLSDLLTHTRSKDFIADKYCPEFYDEVMRALVDGSNENSLFLHASLTFWGAFAFHSMGRANRGENWDDQIMVRIDIWAMWQAWLAANPTGRKNCVDEFYMVNLGTNEEQRSSGLTKTTRHRPTTDPTSRQTSISWAAPNTTRRSSYATAVPLTSGTSTSLRSAQTR